MQLVRGKGVSVLVSTYSS